MSKNPKHPHQDSLRSEFDHEFDSELDWLAFQYVIGELSGEELAVFESRLLDNQQAREAVAAAIELELALRAIPADEYSRLTRANTVNQEMHTSGRGLAVALMLAVAASLLIGLTMLQFSKPAVAPRPGSIEETANVTDADGRLALVWFETRQLSLLGEGLELTDAIADIGVEEFGSLRVEAEDEFAPDWMLAALEAVAEDEATGLEPGERGQN